ALSATASQHVGVVLRMQPGDSLTLFCGDNREFLAHITTVNKKQVAVQVDEVARVSRESPRQIHLAQALSKGDRMEWVIQKAVELGVASITPLFTAHCVVKLDAERLGKKQLQWQAIAIAACEQSGRNQVPTVHPACSYVAYLDACNAATKWILHPSSERSWRDHAFIAGDIALLIGPEGGLSQAEMNQAQSHDFMPLCLGPRVLRTETAAIVALSVLQAVTGDL
ncbi:MAG TPA: 16S rRNA (uracil(1498)-N(3))-methyltransferase, partial [Legionella sp.]|nr:16S rRNA (uracil(1498)-N(3))-methyltransferase [Legionella sp.]